MTEQGKTEKQVDELPVEPVNQQRVLRAEFIRWLIEQGIDPDNQGASYQGEYQAGATRLNIHFTGGLNTLRVESEIGRWNLGIDPESGLRQHLCYSRVSIIKSDGTANRLVGEYGYSGPANGSYAPVPGSRSGLETSMTTVDIFPKVRQLMTLL